MVLKHVTKEQLLDVDRRAATAEKLAVGLLQLLFSQDELRSGNCSKPTRPDIMQLDSERLWAIKCEVL